MNRIFVATVFGLFVSMSGVAFAKDARAESQPRSVLFVLSGEGKQQGKERPGFEMDELAQAWSIFRANQVRTAFASPRGGAVEADKFDAADPANAQFLADADAVAALKATRALAEVRPTDYDAIYIVGGKGAMLDLATDKVLSGLITRVYEQGGVIAAICHGSAALADVRLANGEYLVSGRAVTGFTDEEESVFGKKWVALFPFLIETRLRERGGLWQEAHLMMPNAAVAGRLVTGQNPYSTARVVDAVLRAMNIDPVERVPRKDEASLVLVERAVNGDASVAAELAASLQTYQIELMGLIGHYQLKVAQDERETRAALAAMDLAAPHFDAHELSVSRAEARWRLGRTDEAKALLASVLAKAPDMPEALKLKERLQTK